MATIKTQYTQKTAIGLDVIHPETDASIVLVDVEGIEATNVADALGEINDNIDAITGGGVVTGVKGDAESEYRKNLVNITKANIGLGNVANERQYSASNPPPYPVSSVAGKTGTVTLTKSDVGLSNVDNTSDLNKPISTATQTALNKKASRGEQVFFYKGTLTGGGITECTTGLLHPQPAASTTAEISHYVGAMVLDEIGQCFYVTGASGDPASGSFMFTLQHDDVALKKDTAPTQNSQAFVSSGGVYTAIEAAKTAANTYADTKKTEAVTAAKDYTDQQIQAILGDDVDEAYNSFKEIQDLLEGELGSATDGLIGSVNANTQGVADAKALANGAQATANANTDAIEDIVDGTTKVSKATTADSATSATTANRLSGNQTFTASGDATGSGTWTNSTGAATVSLTLANSGVAAGSYSAVTVDAKGRVTDGAQVIEVGTVGQTEPSANLAVGGIFIKRL